MNTFNHLLAVLASASVCIASAAHGQAVIAKGSNSETILQSSETLITLPTGTSNLDIPTAFTCKSAKGCVVLMSALFNGGANPGNEIVACALVDGVAGAPGCAHNQTQTSKFIREQLTVGQGSHTVGTTVDDEGTGGDLMYGWETDYTIYQIK